MRDGNGVLIAIGDIVPGKGKTRGVEMVEACINAFLATDRQASSLNNRAQPYRYVSSSVRPSLKRLNISARTPSRNSRSRGLWAKNCGVKVKGRSEHPKPLRIMPATAAPVLISS